MDVLLVGAGPMAQDYARVLEAQKRDFKVVGRGIENITKFQKHFPSIECFHGGLEKYLASHSAASQAIAAVPVSKLYDIAVQLLDAGVSNILLEKPGALFKENVDNLIALKKGALIDIAYNRRFYQAVRHAKEIIQEDGGVLSCTFEFTEWVHVIGSGRHSDAILRKWVLANSSHVIDLVFHLCGIPRILHPYISGDDIKWHPSGSIFVGSGVTVRGIPFSYHSNWNSPGRWGVEILTAQHRLYLKPMEKLHVQEKGSVAVEEHVGDYSIDDKFKPGLFNEVTAFFEQHTNVLCSIEEHRRHFEFFETIAGYEAVRNQ